jgi:hypothetical protein
MIVIDIYRSQLIRPQGFAAAYADLPFEEPLR